MILEIQHETRLAYTDPVTESIGEVRMEPGSDADQSCRSFHLAVSPGTGVFRFVDGFGNRVHHFNVMFPHLEVRILAASVVETHPPVRDLAASSAPYPVDTTQGGLELLDFLHLRGPVRATSKLEPILKQLRPAPGMRVAAVVENVSGYIHKHFQYSRHVTRSGSSIEEVLEHGKGVCQDFTHLMIAILRAFAIPTRYISGYIHRVGKESQSHAWCEVWLPDLGWVGIDPTNDCAVDEGYIKVAQGRDFTDVPPNKGVFRGKTSESMYVRVSTRQLDALPSLSWQEQLPPLDAPMTEIVSGRRISDLVIDDDGSQQQQQQ